jgi:hypothetical protein
MIDPTVTDLLQVAAAAAAFAGAPLDVPALPDHDIGYSGMLEMASRFMRLSSADASRLEPKPAAEDTVCPLLADEAARHSSGFDRSIHGYPCRR